MPHDPDDLDLMFDTKRVMSNCLDDRNALVANYPQLFKPPAL